MPDGEYGGHSVLSQELLAVVIPEAVGPEVLGAEAGVGGGDEILHPQAVHPLAGKLRFAEREPAGEQNKETIRLLATGGSVTITPQSSTPKRPKEMKTDDVSKTVLKIQPCLSTVDSFNVFTTRPQMLSQASRQVGN